MTQSCNNNAREKNNNNKTQQQQFFLFLFFLSEAQRNASEAIKTQEVIKRKKKLSQGYDAQDNQAHNVGRPAACNKNFSFSCKRVACKGQESNKEKRGRLECIHRTDQLHVIKISLSLVSAQRAKDRRATKKRKKGRQIKKLCKALLRLL